jgi:hypothetical protein
MPDGVIEVFFSYAHEDEPLRDQMANHLANLQHQGVIEKWHDRKIPPGNEWGGQIETRLNTADIILLLISADFMASDYCYTIEMQRAVERHDRGEACVIPVILRPCDWKGAPFSKLQALPKDALPVTRWQDRDEAFVNIVEGIRVAIGEIKANPR